MAKYKKGESGNPGGRPKMPQEFAEFARKKSMPAFERLVEIAEDKKANHRDVIRAAEIIIAYGYGKPRQDVDITSGGENVNYDISTLASLAGLTIIDGGGKK